MENNLLVISAHALDFLWRAGGTIARYVNKGWKVKVICLTYGERGESNAIWKKNKGITEEEVKKIRQKESEGVAKVLGVSSIKFYNWGDHLLMIDNERVYKLAEEIQKYSPRIILTQYVIDKINFDHSETANAVMKAVRCARVEGVNPKLPTINQPDIYMYDPSQPEFFEFNADTYIDITDYIEKKIEAMSITEAQEYLVKNYITRAEYRAACCRMFDGGKNIKYAEAFVRYSPYVGKEFALGMAGPAE